MNYAEMIDAIFGGSSEPFSSEEEVREYLSLDVMRALFFGEDTYTAKELSQLADHIIDNPGEYPGVEFS